jgi:hypothetical protein
MVKLPQEYIATKYSGYFWNPDDECLYSVKVTGELKPMKPSYAGTMTSGRWYPNYNVPGFKVSVKGVRKFMSLAELKGLKPKNTLFPVWQA